MDITRQEREELKALSQEIFGSSSRYQKLLGGVSELITQTKMEEVPGENGAEPTTKEVKVPVLVNGVKQYRQKYYSVEEVKTLLLDLKRQKEEMMAAMAKQQEEQKAKQEQQNLLKKIHEDTKGSAV